MAGRAQPWVGVQHVVALPGVHRQQRRQPFAGGQPPVGRHRHQLQWHDGPVLGGVRQHLGGRHAQPGTAARVQWMPVDDVLLGGGERVGRGEAGQVPQGRRTAARTGAGWRLGGAGEGEIGDAVVQLHGEPAGGAGQVERAEQPGGVGVRAPAELHREPVRRAGERLGHRRVAGEDPAAVECHGQPSGVDVPGSNAADGLSRQRAPQPGQDARPRPGQRRLVRRRERGPHPVQLGPGGGRIGRRVVLHLSLSLAKPARFRPLG